MCSRFTYCGNVVQKCKQCDISRNAYVEAFESTRKRQAKVGGDTEAVSVRMVLALCRQ